MNTNTQFRVWDKPVRRAAFRIHIQILLAVVLALFAAALFPPSAGAATYYWDNDSDTPGFGTAGGIWAAPTPGPIPGWTTDATGAFVPGSVTTTTSDPINFGAGATGLGAGTITLSGALSSGNITFASGSGPLTLSGGTSLTLPATATITVNNSAATIATPLGGAGTSLIKAGAGKLFLSGANAVTGGLTVNSGELVLGGGSLNLGAKVISVATNAGQVAIVSIVNGSLTNSSSDVIGSGTNAVAVVKVNGGNFVKTAGNFNLGNSNTGKTNSASFLMSDGYTVIGGEFGIAFGGVAGYPSYAYAGLSGGLLICSNYVTVGREGWGVLDISGGTLLRPATAVNRFYMNRSAGSFSQLTIRGTGTLAIEDAVGLRYANSATGAGTAMVNLLTGGTLISRTGISYISTAASSLGHINFNGGTLKASGSSGVFWTNLWSACYLYAGGATIDSQDNSITVSQPFLAPSGSGVTAITGGTGSGYLAAPVVKIEGGGGIGATAVAEVDANGNVVNILITNPGVDYTSPPSVSLAGGGGTASGWTASIGANATTGGLTKLGTGTLTLTGASTYAGPTRVGAGTLGITAVGHPSSSALTLSNSAALKVDVTGGPSTLATPALTLDSNSSLTFSYGALGGNPVQPAVSDPTLSVGTTVNTRGTNILINLSGSGFTAGQFPIIKYAGGISGNGFAAFKLGTKPAGVPLAQLVNNTANGSIDIVIPAVNLVTWNGTNANWDINTTYNWRDAAMAPSRYAEYGTTNIYGDIVTFDDSLSDFSQTNINLTATLRPSTINLTASGSPYAFSGPGKISGGTYLNVSGPASVTLRTVNDYTGGSTLAAGTVLLGADSALGTGPLIMAGSVLSSDSPAPRALSNSVSISVDSTFGLDATSGALTLSGPVDLGGGAPALTVNSQLALTGAAANGGLTKWGAGTLVLDNPATALAGVTTVFGGKVALHNGSFSGALNIAPTLSQTGVVEIVSANVTNTAQNNIATGADAVGMIKQSGGSFVETGVIAFGSAVSSSAAYIMSGGFAYLGGDTRLDNAGAVGLISQSGGTMVSGNYVSLARDGGLGVYDLSGGLHYRPANAANRFYLTRSAGSTAQLTVRGTGTMDIDDPLGLSFANSYTFDTYGSVNLLTGGTIISRVGLFWGNTGAGTIGCVNFNGGTLRASGSSADYWSGWTAGYIYSSGAKIDSQEHSITIGQALLSPTGNGVTSITGGTGSGYLFPPVVTLAGDGTGATAIAQIDANGNVTAILVTNPGVNYTTPPIVSLSGGGGSWSGWNATIGPNPTGGALTKLGSGTLVLSGTNTYLGPTVVSSGSLVLGKAHAAPGTVTVADGATLGCWSDTPGAIVQVASATLGASTGAGLLAQFSGTTGNPTSPAGHIANLTLNGPTAVSVFCSGLQVGTIPLLRYSTLSGAGSLTTGTLPQGVLATVSNNTATKTIELVITSIAPLIWSGASSGTWDINTSSNWVLGTVPTAFQQGDSVRFDDTAVNPAIVITQSVSPGGVVVSNNTLAYTVGTSGAGALGGTTGLTKAGTNTLVLSGANTYLGETLISGGTIQLGDGGTTGSLATGGSVKIDAGAALVLNRSDTAGFGSQNISGSGVLNKIGTSDGPALTGTNTFSGQINIVTATLALVGSESENGEPRVYVAPGARLAIGNGFNGGFATIGNLTGGGSINASYTAGAGTRGLQVNQTTDGTFDGVIADGTSSRLIALTKTGPAMLILTGTNTYTGPTTVSNGTLIVNGAISNSTVTVNPGTTFGGGGTVATTVSVAGGSVFTNLVGAPFTVGTLDLAGNVALNVAAATPLSAGQYPIIKFSALTGPGQFTSLSVGGAGLAIGATANVVVDTSSVYLNVVGGGPAPTNITCAVIAGQLVLDWPAGQGWQLQCQTNGLSTGLSNNWFTVPNAVPPYTNAIGTGNPAVFYRLAY